MAKIKNNRRRDPSAPTLKLHLHGATDPTSPPETPTASPLLARSKHPYPHQQHQAPLYRYSRPLSQDPNIKPVGNGHQFSYQPALGPEQLSPRSSSSSSSGEEDVEESDSDVDSSSDEGIEAHSLPNSAAAHASDDEQSESDEDSEHESEPGSASGSDSDADGSVQKDHYVQVISTSTTLECEFIIEDIDPMDSECEGLDVLHPTEIESNRSRSRSRHKDLDKGMMQDLKNLNCSNEASENEGGGLAHGYDEDEEVFLQRRQELRRIRRVSMSSSFGKRTHSELSDSDNDDAGTLDVNDVGSSARRMRKRLHRGSLLFQDPPEPRIDELEEPDSSEDEYPTVNSLARELPYYTMEIMEMDSS
ncbi:hypothetical protein TOPH_08569 [Tolypocladium ophioglossoides CBS 100239]|uniref:Uncharacterized protein n=1 Tax=Tolypocladium ophioglossoides (strain CBS 100239) TaxID=1163406 RepID=A0A0L0MY80_TOLOC|nr:hypothetical protein TOPH_08569 [Tolypocladium ophioglossoides CBS 100239]